ncbi:MAG: elongation factor G [Deltaproteobacteria bacterium]|nr:elongation factor G [Deltaproteobacteria bacterium]
MAIEAGRLRNVGLLGHRGAGKTSLGEALLFAAGSTNRVGRVDDGSSAFDYEPEEIHRQVSISSAFHSLEWQKTTCVLVDTPGFATFLPETVHSLPACGGAVFVLHAGAGLRVEAERLWAFAAERGLPRMFFVNRLDREESDPMEAVDAIVGELGGKAIHVQVPIGHGEGFRGVVDLIRMKAVCKEGDNPETEEDIPAELQERAEEMRVSLMENVAETQDELLEKYLEGQELTAEELSEGLRAGVQAGSLFPVLYGSATRSMGVAALLDGIVAWFPTPLEEAAAEGRNPVTEEEETRDKSADAPFSAFVFKTIVDPFAGRLSIMRVLSGTLKADSTVYNPAKDAKERITHIFRPEGGKQEEVSEAGAGEIVAAAKLKDVASGDTLCDESAPITYPRPVQFTPSISFALSPKTRADEDKVPQALQRMMEEDPSITMHRDDQTREFILSGTGQLHIEVVVDKLKRKYGAEVELKAPKVPYRETIRSSANAQGKYKKQSGGRGQYGDTWLKIEPLPRGKGFEFVDKIVGGAIPRNYIPAVEKGIVETMTSGYLAGFPIMDVRATLYDGSFHTVDSSDMAFKIAASMGFKNAMEAAKPVILEPVMAMEVTVPDESMGDVIGDLNSRRGKVLGVDAKGHSQIIKAQVPMAEVLRYASDLRSMTSGRGEFQSEFSHYDELPAHLMEKVQAEAKAKADGD